MEQPPPPLAILALPLASDSLPVLHAKLSSYVYAAHIGRSVAAATGYALNASEEQTPEACAVSQMKPLEQEYFQRWREGKLPALPPVDWAKDRGHTPSTGRPLKKATRRAEALNRMYSTEQAQPCHYTFFVENHTIWLPLIKAVARIIGAERDRRLRMTRWSSYKSEIKTIQAVTTISRRIVLNFENSPVKEQILERIQCQEQKGQSTSLGKRKAREDIKLGTVPEAMPLEAIVEF